MKDLYTLITLFIVSFGFSQETLEDFEATSASVASFGGATASIVDDPVTSGGVNGKVAQGNSTSTGGEVWQGYTIALMTKNIDLSTNKTLTLDVYSTVAGEFAVKVQAGVDGASNSTKNAAHAGNGWENITVDFGSGNVDGTGAANGAYGEVAIFLNWDSTAGGFGTPVDKTFYVDNITGVGIDKPVVPAPEAGPSTPPARDAADVISIYGEAYGTAIGVSNVGWDGGSDSVEETIAGNAVLKTTYNDFLGLDLGSEVDASGMTHMHMDFWIADDYAVGQVFKPKWSNHNGSGETDAFDYTYAVAENDNQSWLSIDVALDDFVTQAGGGSAARANLKQLVIGVAATLDLVYIDNIYFYIAQTASIDDLQNNIHVYPNPAKDTVRISAAESIDRMRIYDLTGKLVKQASPHKAAFSVDVSGLSKGVYLVKLNAGDREATTKMIK